MKAIVVYESCFGNTYSVCTALAEGLREAGADVEQLEVSAAQGHALDCDLLVLGAPTHSHGLPTAGTRKQAASAGGQAPVTGIRELLEQVNLGQVGRCVLLDTVSGHGFFYGSAAKDMAKRLKRRGGVAAEHRSFTVEGSEGPLAADALDEAKAGGRELTGSSALTQQD